MASPYWQMVKDLDFDNVPDTYLDFLLSCDWFNQKWKEQAEEVVKELATRKRSHYHIPDQFGKTLEED